MKRRTLTLIGGLVLIAMACGPRPMPNIPVPKPKKKAPEVTPKQQHVLKSSGNANFDILRPYFTRFLQKRESLPDPFKSNLALFAPKVSIVVAETREQKKETPKTPLEYHDLSFYKLDAVISGTAIPKAMVIDGKGTPYVVKIGTPIGNKGGRVTAITADGIVVEEPGKAPVTMKLIENSKEMAKVIQSMYEY